MSLSEKINGAILIGAHTVGRDGFIPPSTWECIQRVLEAAHDDALAMEQCRIPRPEQSEKSTETRAAGNVVEFNPRRKK